MKKTIKIILTVIITAILFIQPYFVGGIIFGFDYVDFVGVPMVWLAGFFIESCTFLCGCLLILFGNLAYTLSGDKIK